MYKFFLNLPYLITFVKYTNCIVLKLENNLMIMHPQCYTISMEEELVKLKAENERLNKMNQVKSEWISIAAHQLRTSLSAIKWILKMFIDGDFGKLSQEQDSMMSKAYGSNERMLALIQEMLSLNHNDEATLTYDIKENNLMDIIESTLFDFTGESFKKGVEIVFLRPEETIPLLPFDKEKIRVVIQNLIENAIKYSRKSDKVFIGIHVYPDTVSLTVKDTGIGIPQSQQEHIFEKFFRATNAKEKEEIGSGLGLYTVKNIIIEHGGTITFESKDSEGTTFTITLPLHKASH